MELPHLEINLVGAREHQGLHALVQSKFECHFSIIYSGVWVKKYMTQNNKSR